MKSNGAVTHALDIDNAICNRDAIVLTDRAGCQKRRQRY